jgi:hypothetical protein
MNRYIVFAKYNADTGEITGSSVFPDMETVLFHFGGEILDTATIVEITNDEYDLIGEREPETARRKYKVDLQRVKKFVIDRPKIDVPIEIDGIGGKEIIGYEQKPESIVTERQKPATEIEAK